jgi:hypothetical protein
MDYTTEERNRCRHLVEKLARGAGKEFLLFCIDKSVQHNEIEQFRQRFAEFTPDVEDIL